VPIRHHFHGCKAPLARASHVKWRYTKYLALTFNLSQKNLMLPDFHITRHIYLQCLYTETVNRWSGGPGVTEPLQSEN